MLLMAECTLHRWTRERHGCTGKEENVIYLAAIAAVGSVAGAILLMVHCGEGRLQQFGWHFWIRMNTA